MSTKPYVSHEEATIESFRRDPAFAAAYLDDVLEDGDVHELPLALGRVAKAFGVSEVAEKAELNAKTLYRTFSEVGNPELRTLVPLLKTMGLRLSVAPLLTSPFITHAALCSSSARGSIAAAHRSDQESFFRIDVLRSRSEKVNNVRRFASVDSGSNEVQMLDMAVA